MTEDTALNLPPCWVVGRSAAVVGEEEVGEQVVEEKREPADQKNRSE